jgi:DNA-directed RNA polymerase subunit RPC12/RpoP
MTRPISFRCSSCNAQLKAPVQLQGMTRNCPGCGRRVTVPGSRLQDAGPVLVFDDRWISSNFK